MVRWFRRGNAVPPASRVPSSGPNAAPPTPGGTGGSGFGAVGSTTDAPTPGRNLPRLGLGAGPTAEEQRFTQVYAADRVGPMPYPNQASPDVAAARGRVRALVNELLPNGVDEGTGGALDPLIASWASGWLARIDSEHADHHAVVDRLIGGARQQLAQAEADHERDRRALEISRRDYTDARESLMEPFGAEDTANAAADSGGGQGRFRRAAAGVAQRRGRGSAPQKETTPGGTAQGGATQSGTARAASIRSDTADPTGGPPEPATGPMPTYRPTLGPPGTAGSGPAGPSGGRPTPSGEPIYRARHAEDTRDREDR